MISDQAKAYYSYHIARNNTIFSDKIIFSPHIVFFKEDVWANSAIVQRYTDEWAVANVITCAAPYWQKGLTISEDELLQIMKKRIQNIFEVAIENETDALILGAFGCGAFHNPPLIVAEAFRQVMVMPRYINAFKKIIFAIKRTDVFCPNIEAFEVKFLEFPFRDYAISSERNKRRFFE